MNTIFEAGSISHEVMMGMMYNTTVSSETHLTSMISRGQNLEEGFFFSKYLFSPGKTFMEIVKVFLKSSNSLQDIGGEYLSYVKYKPEMYHSKCCNEP